MPVEAPATGVQPPDWNDVRDYMGGNLTDAQLIGISLALPGELAAQAATCRVEPYTHDLREAAVRRVVCNVARRSLPLGVQMTDMGGTPIGTYDPEVRRLERPYRKLVVG